jgi:hypothetical protein
MKRILLLISTTLLASVLSFAQESPASSLPADSKYSMNALLIMTPEQCNEKVKKGGVWSGKETFKVGEEITCPAAEAVAQQVFQQFTKIAAIPAESDRAGKITLSFRAVDTEATRTITAFGKRKMVLLLEWIATDEHGKTFWVQTIEGTAEEKSGNIFTYKKHLKAMLGEVRNDLIAKSIKAMKESREFQKVAEKPTNNH